MEMIFAFQSTHYHEFLPGLSRNKHLETFPSVRGLARMLSSNAVGFHIRPTGGLHTWPPSLSSRARRELAAHGSQYLDSWL